MLTREQILGADDRKIETVDVPEWGGSVGIRTLSARDRDAYDQSIVRRNDDGSFDANLQDSRARLCAAAICDESGKSLFTIADIAALTQKSAAALDRLVEAIKVQNHMTPEAVASAEKN